MPDIEITDQPAGRIPGEVHWRLRDHGTVVRGFHHPGAAGRSGVFLHGFRSNCDGGKARRLAATAIEQGWDWLRFDQRACGRSEGVFRQFTVGGAVAGTRRVLDALDATSYVIVGSSLGALIAARVAAAAPRRIAGLVLVAPALRFTHRFIHGQLDAAGLAAWHQRGYRWFPDLYGGGVYRLDYGFCEDALRDPCAPEKLACPVRVIHGSRDELLPVADTENWLSRLDCPSAGLEIIDGGDHQLTDWSDNIVRCTETLWNETL